MNPYYTSLLKDVVDLFAKGEYEKVDSIVSQELSLPYIPGQAEELLRHYQDECRPYLAKVPAANRAQLEDLVDGTTAQKEMAASMLQAMNLRQYHAEVQKLLNAEDLVQEFKGELIEALMEQRIDEHYVIIRNGKKISFVPASIKSKKEDDGYQKARAFLHDWLDTDNPVMADFCEQMLDQELLENRPLDFQDKDPKALAAAIVRLVCDAMSDEETWQALSGNDDFPDGSYKLLIKERGE